MRNRRPRAAVLFHSDRGTEYAASAFQERLAELGFTQSMNRPGKMTDNAFIESFFLSMKSDIYHGLRYEHAEANGRPPQSASRLAPQADRTFAVSNVMFGLLPYAVLALILAKLKHLRVHSRQLTSVRQPDGFPIQR